MEKLPYEYYPVQITDALCSLVGFSDSEWGEIEEAIYRVREIAKNNLNPNWWRTLYDCLQHLCSGVECIDIKSELISE